MFGRRSVNKIIKAIFGRQHYIAFINMLRFYPEFRQNMSRYLTGTGQYPYAIRVRTPIGLISPTLYSHHDLLTVNEIFCRLDYKAGQKIRTVVDLGSNIGISALYFLTRNKQSKCCLYEPDERNTAKLVTNLTGFEERYELVKKAVSYKSGVVEFGIEASGRYGGIGRQTGEMIKVECVEINTVLGLVLDKVDFIDILKIDTEGVEVESVAAINPEFLKRIKTIYLEAEPKHFLHPDFFWQKQYGSVCQMNNKN